MPRIRCALSTILALGVSIAPCAALARQATPLPAATVSTPTPPDTIKRIPPPGVPLPEADRAELVAGVEALGKEVEALRTALRGKSDLLRYLPDVQIFHNAVRYALTYDEFYDATEVVTAKKLLFQGRERAKALREGKAPWTTQPGLVALGYISRIDGSVQPYGLVVPQQWAATDRAPRRLDIFLHGRGEKLTELNFINERQTRAGEFTPEGAFVLHPYGRYCNANRYAGEVDLFEALEDVKRRYPVDSDRLILRGFSMGGAACWQFATHHADRWAGAAPGAGFTETPEYTQAFAPGKPQPTWWEQKLWRLYDPVDYAVNLFNCPTIAYSGEIDKQKQAADKMTEALAKENMPLAHVIGPQTGHKYHPQSKIEINRHMDDFALKGRPSLPRHVRFTTWTLRYPRQYWVTVQGLQKHWERARVEGELLVPGIIRLTTENVSSLSLNLPGEFNQVFLDGVRLEGRRFARDANGKWTVAKDRFDDPGILRKRPGLQGPIDDAFLESFVFVRPTGKPLNEAVGRWAEGEMGRAIREWRSQFRGEARVVEDREVSGDVLKNSNLVLWGDPSSNRVLAKIAAKLPIRWDAQGVRVGATLYPAGTCVPVLIYPNPLNPSRYIVINSGHTFREAHYRSNALQTPKLPDWAVVDITTPPGPHAPGRIANAGFFDEQWRLGDRY